MKILPVVKRDNRSSIVNASLKKAPFWSSVKTMKLSENMRIKSNSDGKSSADSDKQNAFTAYLLEIGELKI